MLIKDCLHEVENGYPVYVAQDYGWDLVAYIYAPMVPSPRPRVTKFGTFMPKEYKAHCVKLGVSMAYARAIVETRTDNRRTWNPECQFKLDLCFWAPKQRGDLDNVAKTIMDAGQLARGETTGAELWCNDSQIFSLSVDYCEMDEENQHVVLRVMSFPAIAKPQPARKRVRKTKPTDAPSEKPKARKTAKAAKQ